MRQELVAEREGGLRGDLMPERLSESVRTLSRAILCPGCERPFTPRRANQRHCRSSCRKLAERESDARRRGDLLERLDPHDSGRNE